MLERAVGWWLILASSLYLWWKVTEWAFRGVLW
jgi:hypothetical protein